VTKRVAVPLQKLPGDSVESKGKTLSSLGLGTRHARVLELVGRMIEQGTFSVKDIKKETKRAFKEHNGQTDVNKPNGLHISEMFDYRFLQSGEEEIDPATHHVKVEVMDELHRGSCGSCTQDKVCHWPRLRRCVTHGWHPLLERELDAKYIYKGNNKLSDLFPEAFKKGVEEFTEGTNGWKPVLRPVTKLSTEGKLRVNPMGIVLKNSDKARARILTGIIVESQESLTEANKQLLEGGHDKVKARVTVNPSSINSASYVPPFSYPSVADAVRLIKPGCWLGKGDVSRYYLMFPLASACWWLFAVNMAGLVYQFICLFFGLAGGAYYASIWSAEMRQWVLAAGIPAVHYMDDWLTIGDSERKVRSNMAGIHAIVASAGFGMSDEKFGFGQRLLFLGLLLDTLAMTITFDKVQCDYMVLVLVKILANLKRGIHGSSTENRHIAGKLNWYAEVVQSARPRVHSWWSYLRSPKAFYHESGDKLIEDISWWIKLFGEWSEGERSKEYPILSAEVLKVKTMTCCSDASMPHGFGYYHGPLRCELDHLRYASVSWDEGQLVPSSTWAELYALKHYIRDVDFENGLVVWITDSLSGAYIINSSNAHESLLLELLSDILDICDTKTIYLVAVWIPREENVLADFLSHLSFLSGRLALEGGLGGLFRDEEPQEPRSSQ
jgi:hypothetical protein